MAEICWKSIYLIVVPSRGIIVETFDIELHAPLFVERNMKGIFYLQGYAFEAINHEPETNETELCGE